MEVKFFDNLNEKSDLFPLLNNVITLAVFISLGNMPEENELLNI